MPRTNRVEIPADKIVEIRDRMKKHSIPTELGCWEWKLARNKCGYGNSTCGDIRGGAHRISHAAFIGPVPEGLYVCHRCDNPPCVNPDHLFLGTDIVNVHDMMAKGRDNFGRGNLKEMCAKGLHKMTGDNVLFKPRTFKSGRVCNSRQCRECKEESIRKYFLNKAPIHYTARRNGLIYCGKETAQKLSDDASKVTCKMCLRSIRMKG